MPWAEPVGVEPAAAEHCAQRNDDCRGVVVPAHLSDEAAPRFERAADSGENRLWRVHPMQCRI